MHLHFVCGFPGHLELQPILLVVNKSCVSLCQTPFLLSNLETLEQRAWGKVTDLNSKAESLAFL